MKQFNTVTMKQAVSHKNNASQRRMMSKRNKNKALSVLAAALVLCPVAMNQPNGGAAQPWLVSQAHAQVQAQAQTRTFEAPLVDWSHAQQVYRLAEGWLSEGEPGLPLEGERIEVSGLTGVRVTLRWLGLRMGTGQVSFEANKPEHGKAMDLTQMTRTAVRGAMLQVNDKLRQAASRGLDSAAADEQNSSQNNDSKNAGDSSKQPATNLRTIADLKGMLLMDIQIAGRLQTILVPAGSPADTLYHQFAPGYHGLRLTTRAVDGTPLASWLWPADSIAAGQTPHAQILQLMSGLGIKFGKEITIARPGGPQLESFEVIHMVRPGINQPITRLTRGNVMLPPTSVDARTLDAISTRIAAHLQARLRQDGQFPGTYLPSSDRHISQQASLADGALACYALSRWAVAGSLKPSDPQIAAAHAKVRLWFEANLPALLDEKINPAPAALALGLMTLTQNPALANLRDKRDQLALRLFNLRQDEGSFHTTTAKDAPEVDVPVGALIVDSLATYYLATQSTRVGNALPDTMNWVWDRTDPLRSIGALPWLLDADAKLETLTTRDGQNLFSPRSSRAARLARLLPTIEIIMNRQIIAPPANGPADVIGGFELREQDPTSPPNPDWRTAHMLMVISQSLRNTDLAVGRNRVEGILACGRAARFLGQLMFDEPGAYYVRNPANVIGGVRPVLWDNRLDLAPSAMTLLATTDLRKTLAQWANNQ